MVNTRMNTLLSVLVMIMTSFSGIGQSDSTALIDTNQYKIDLDKAGMFLGTAQYDSSIIYAQKSMEQSMKYGFWEPWYRGFEKIAYCYLYQNSFDKIDSVSEDYIKIINENNGDSLYLAKLYGWLGYSNYFLEGEKEMEANIKGIQVFEGMNKPEQAASLYQNVGITYTMRGDFTKALNYLESAEKYSLEQGKINELRAIRVNMAHAYKARGEFDKCFKKCDEIIELNGLDFTTAIILTEVNRRTNNLDEARKYLEKAASFPNKTLNDEFIYHVELAQMEDLTGGQNVEKSYIKAISIADETGKISDRETAKAKIDLAQYYLDQLNYEGAHIYFDESLHHLDSTFLLVAFKDQNYYEYIPLKNGIWIMEALYGMARAQEGLMANQTSQKGLNKALLYYINCYFVVENLRLNYETEDSKLFLADHIASNAIYERGLNFINENLDAFRQNETIYDIIIYILEKSRNFVLTSTLNDIKIKSRTGIPDSLLEREKLLGRQAFDLKKQNQLDKEGRDSERLFAIQRELEELNRHFKTNYPSYYKSKMTSSTPSYVTLREKHLKDDQAIIYYLWGREKLFSVYLTKKELKIFDQPIDKVVDPLSKYFVALRSNAFDAKPEYYFNQLTQLSQELYSILIKDQLVSLGADIDELIILPDSKLHFLSFESLIVEKKGNDISYSLENLSYLLEKYAISYANSLEIHYDSKILPKDKSATVFSGFAPGFSKENGSGVTRSCSDEELASLKHNKDEVMAIYEITGGEKYFDKQASLSNFITQSKSSRILHLATHACASSEDARDNKIYFSGEEFLTLDDIYQLETKAEMVVLSACETGVGKIAEGEGIMSLARGFAFAGVPSVLMSLWAMPDKSTSNIMSKYYSYLDRGLNKSKALQQAKIDFVNESSGVNKHPHYWASLVIIGNNDAVDLRSGNQYVTYLILGLLIILILAFLMYKRKGK